MSRKSVVLAAATAVLSLVSAPQIVNSRSLAREAQENEKGKQTFTGTILKSTDHYILNDTTNKVTYELDDPKKASVFLGKKVKVIGTLDADKKLIHIEAIAEMA